MDKLPSKESPAEGMEALRWKEMKAAYRPDYNRSLVSVFPTLFSLLGHEIPQYQTLQPYLGSAVPKRAKRVMLLCLDGLGFKELSQSRRLKHLYNDYGTWVTSVFPTITSCALSSLYQGLPPARHGLPGHVIWKDYPGAVVDMLKGRVPGATASLKESGFNTGQWRREPGILDTGVGKKMPGYHLMDSMIVSSGLSEVIYGHSRRIGFHDPVEGYSKAGRILADLPEGWVSMYLPRVDTVSHVLEGDSPEVGLVVRQVEESLGWMAGTLPKQVLDETVLMVAADHGQNNLKRFLPLYGENLAWLKAHTKAVGHSGRVLHVYLNGKDESSVTGWLEKFVGEAGHVFTFDQIKQLTAPGDYWAGADEADNQWLRQSLGDLVVVLNPGWNWEKHDPEGPPHPDAPYQSKLVSQHGALSWDEMFIPFIVTPLNLMLPE